MITSAIRHLSFYPFVQALARNRIQWRLEAAPGDLTACELVCWKRSEPEVLFRTSLLPGLEDGQRQQWTGETVFTGETHYIKYGFWLEDQAGNRRWLNDRGLFTDMQESGSFELLQVNETDISAVPAWAQGCIYYQIFPERFARRGPAGAGMDDWNAAPTRDNVLGGNLGGIIDRIPYLSELGVECLYLNPIFTGDFNHKYATTDYFSVDPMFGTKDTLRELVALRGEAQGWCGQTLPLAPMELAFDLSPDSTLGLDFAGALQLTVNRDGLRLSRRGLQTAEMHHRYWRGEARRLRIFIDRSSVEIFINDGEGVMSSRFFPGYPGQLIFSGATPVAFCRWLLRPCMVE